MELIDARGDASLARMALGHDGRRDVDPTHQLPTENTPQVIRVAGKHHLGHTDLRKRGFTLKLCHVSKILQAMQIRIPRGIYF